MEKKEKSFAYRYGFLALSLAIIILFRFLPVPASLEAICSSIEGGSGRGAMTLLGILLGVVILWITEAIPLAVSAMFIPIFIGLFKIDKFNAVFKETFGSNVFAFFMGILAISIACRKSNLSKRLAAYFGMVSSKKPAIVLLGVMSISFFISMWITDMAAVGIMIPIGVAVLTTVGALRGESNFGKAIMLGISWGSVFGGITTPSGVSSNIIAMTFLGEAGVDVTFTQWLSICFPIGLIDLILGWLILLLVFKPEVKEIAFDRDEMRKIIADEKWTKSQIWIVIVFVAMIIAFLTSDKTGLNINLIAFMLIPLLMLPGISAFKDFKDFQSSLNWGAIILAVAGVSLGTYAQNTGLSSWIAQVMLSPVAKLPGLLQLGGVSVLTDIGGLVLSSMNITATIFVPIVIDFAAQTGASVFAMALAATCASSTVIVLVTQTPTLVLTYAEGYYSIKDCAKAGIIMTIISAVVVAVWLTLMVAVGMV